MSIHSELFESIHIWRIAFSNSLDSVNFFGMLSDEEKNKAASFRYLKDARHYICCRGMLRCLISDYLKIPQDQIVFSYNVYGKPALSPAHPLKFNLSHTNDSVLFAFGWDTELGVDLEEVKPLKEQDEIAEDLFSNEEQEFLQNLPENERVRHFYRFWTRKEALLKAIGLGFSKPGLDVLSTIDTNEHSHAIQNEIWHLHEIDCFSQQLGALAYSGHKRAMIFNPSETFHGNT